MDTIPDSTPKRQPHNDFYTYMLRRPATPDTPPDIIFPDGTVPFYIGKGRENRILMHEACARTKQECSHVACRVIRKVWREGNEIVADKVDEHLTETEAFTQERLLISFGREIGWPLRNLTDGGEGVSGYRWTDEQKQARSDLAKEMIATNERYANFLYANVGRKHIPEVEEKRRQSLVEAWSDPELREMQSQHSKQMWERPEHREKQRQAMASPEVREKLAYWKGKESPQAKTYPGFMSPDGVFYPDVKNITRFAHEHGLQASGMCLVAQGKQASHLGWTLYPPIEKSCFKGLGFISPLGEVFTAIPHLSKFCKEHNLSQQCMSQVNTGKRKSYKGWTRYDGETSQPSLFDD